MSSTVKIKLIYAPKPRRRKRRLWVTLIAFLLLATASIIFRNWEKAAWQQGVYLYWQHRCLTYTAPPDKIVYEDDPIAATKLIANDKNYHPPGRIRFDEGWYPAPPATWRPPAVYESPELQHIIAPLRSYTAVFCHQRRTKGGLKFLVVTRIGCTAFGPKGHDICIMSNVYSSATWKDGSRVIRPYVYNGDFFYHLASTDHLQMFAGQPDLSDESRFTISYILNGAAGLIDAQFLDPGHWREYLDRPGIKLVIRSGTLALPMGANESADWR